MYTKHITISLPMCLVVKERTVKLKDLTTVAGGDRGLASKLGEHIILALKDNEDRAVLSALTVISYIEEACPGVFVSNVGETEVIIKYKPKKKKQVNGESSPEKDLCGFGKGLFEVLKVAFVSLAIFFGSVFTIMTFNSDVDVDAVFDYVYGLANYNANSNILEVSYSVGIFLGIMIFFNHMSKNKMKADPTPIKVQMQVYEQGINQTVIKEATRSGEVK